jgi:hypothetical protein
MISLLFVSALIVKKELLPAKMMLDSTGNPGYPCSPIANGRVCCCVCFIIQWSGAVPEDYMGTGKDFLKESKHMKRRQY